MYLFLKNEKVNHMFQAFSSHTSYIQHICMNIFFYIYDVYSVFVYMQHTSMCMFNMCLHLISGEDVRQSCAAEGVDSPCAGLAW